MQWHFVKFRSEGLVDNIAFFGERWVVRRRKANRGVTIFLTEHSGLCPQILAIVEIRLIDVIEVQAISPFHFCYIYLFINTICKQSHIFSICQKQILPIFKGQQAAHFYFILKIKLSIEQTQSHCMKPRFQSQQFPAHMSQYYQEKETQETTLEIINEDTTDSVFHKKVFSICDIIGNFGEGFILVHFEGYIYLVDQHAASQKSLFLQYMINPTQKYSVNVSFTTQIANYLRHVLYEKDSLIRNQGWQFEEVKKKALCTEFKIIKAPLIYNKQLQQEDFCFLIEKLYNEKVDEDTSYSDNERNAMATFACRNAYKVGDRLKASEMRGLLDSLYKMDAPFNCPHGRPTIASVGRVVEVKKNIRFQKQYKL